MKNPWFYCIGALAWISSLAVAMMIGMKLVHTPDRVAPPVDVPPKERTSHLPTSLGREFTSRASTEAEMPSPEIAPEGTDHHPFQDANSPSPKSARENKAPLASIDALIHGDIDAFRNSMLHLDEEGIHRAIQVMETIPPGPFRRHAQLALVSRWAEINPLAALDFAHSVPEPELRDATKTAALKSWATREPMQALVYAELSSPHDLPRHALDSIFSAAGEASPDNALLFLAKVDPEKYKSLSARLVHQLYAKDPEKIVSWTEQQPPGTLKDGAVLQVIDHWARYDPLAAKAWMEQNSHPNIQLKARIELAESWARVDPLAAASWFQTLPADQQNHSVIERVFRRWWEFEPNTAATWLEKQENSPWLDTVKDQYIQGILSKDPHNAATWATSISDESKRTQTLRSVAWSWVRRDPNTTIEFMTNAGLPEKDLQRLISYHRERQKNATNP